MRTIEENLTCLYEAICKEVEADEKGGPLHPEYYDGRVRMGKLIKQYFAIWLPELIKEEEVEDVTD